MRTWSVRGTLHLLPIRVAEQQLSLLAKGSWQRAFAPLSVMTALTEQVEHALDGGPLTRERVDRDVRGPRSEARGIPPELGLAQM